MSSPWDAAIAQAMQRHGGSNRSIPKAAPPKPALEEQPNAPADPEAPGQARNDADSSGKPESR